MSQFKFSALAETFTEKHKAKLCLVHGEECGIEYLSYQNSDELANLVVRTYGLRPKRRTVHVDKDCVVIDDGCEPIFYVLFPKADDTVGLVSGLIKLGFKPTDRKKRHKSKHHSHGHKHKHKHDDKRRFDENEEVSEARNESKDRPKTQEELDAEDKEREREREQREIEKIQRRLDREKEKEQERQEYMKKKEEKSQVKRSQLEERLRSVSAHPSLHTRDSGRGSVGASQTLGHSSSSHSSQLSSLNLSTMNPRKDKKPDEKK